MIYEYYVNCFKNGEPTSASGYVEANSEEEAINKAIEPYDKNAYEFLELKEIYRGKRKDILGLIKGEEEVKFYDTNTETTRRT